MQNHIALCHIRTERAGSIGYQSDRPRRHAEVWHDQKRYLYNLRGAGITAREFKAFMRDAWRGELDNGARISGQWPSYTID